MRIALLYTSNPGRKIALNKDLNGGLGTADDYGDSVAGKILSWLKWKFIALPVISIAHAQAILKSKGHDVRYYEDSLPDEPVDIAFIYGSIVDYTNENAVIARLKKRFPTVHVGVFGMFPSRYPDHFPAADFVIGGEIEAFLLYDDVKRLRGEKGLIKVDKSLIMDDLPCPDYTGFPVARYSYRPMLPKLPYLPLTASKGCPYSCGFYCTYGEYQGAKYRQRSASKVYEDMRHLRDVFGVRSIQFRDPTFGIDKRFVTEFCDLLTKNPLNIEWGMETRSDLLNEAVLDQLKAAGLRSINIGIETLDPAVAKANQRKLDDENHQEKLIAYAKKIGVRVNAFFIFGLEDDTPEGLERTTAYALKLDPAAARFCVSTPYPGTEFYEKIKKDDRLLVGNDWERFTQFSLSFKHPHLSPKDVERQMVKAYAKFYFRPSYLFNTFMTNVWEGRS